MHQEDKAIKKKIILATLTCIERDGIHNVTNRSIAKEAGVNSAAINYYFVAKEKLIDEALHFAIDNAISDSTGILSMKHTNLYVNIYALFLYFLMGMLRYPGLMKAFFYEPFTQGTYMDGFTSQLGRLLESFLASLKSYIPDDEKENIKLSIVQMASSTLFIGLFPGAFKEFTGFSFDNMEQQKNYMTHLLKTYTRVLGLSSDNGEESMKQIEELVDYYFNNM